VCVTSKRENRIVCEFQKQFVLSTESPDRASRTLVEKAAAGGPSASRGLARRHPGNACRPTVATDKDRRHARGRPTWASSGHRNAATIFSGCTPSRSIRELDIPGASAAPTARDGPSENTGELRTIFSSDGPAERAWIPRSAVTRDRITFTAWFFSVSGLAKDATIRRR